MEFAFFEPVLILSNFLLLNHVEKHGLSGVRKNLIKRKLVFANRKVRANRSTLRKRSSAQQPMRMKEGLLGYWRRGKESVCFLTSILFKCHF